MTVHIENESGKGFDFPYEETVRDVVNAVLDAEDCPYEADVSVLVTDDASIREINRETRGLDRATDVLSFPMLTLPNPSDFSKVEEDGEAFHPESGELLLGDIVLSVDRIREQARLYGHSEKRELAFLVAHSMLHLLGYDHPDPSEKTDVPVVMEEKQEAVLQALGILRD